MVIPSVCPSVRPSVCPSVTSRYRFKPRWDRDSGFLPYDSVESLVCCDLISCRWLRRLCSNAGIKEEHPSRNRYFTVINSSSVRTVADRYRLAAYHKHCSRSFWRYQHRWPWRTVNPKNRGFSGFFAISRCDAHLKSEFLPFLHQDYLHVQLKWCCRASHEH